MYFCIYISIRRGGGSRIPAHICAYLPASDRIMRCQRNIWASSATYARQNPSISAVYSQCVHCYGISCHQKVTVNSSDVRNWGSNAKPMHKICHPLGVMVIVNSPTADYGLALWVSHTGFGITCYSCNGAGNGRGRRSGNASRKGRTLILSYLLRFTYK